MVDLTDADLTRLRGHDFDAVSEVERIAKRITDVHLAPLVRRLDPHRDRADFMAVHNAVGSCVSLMSAAALLRDERSRLLDHLATLTAERDAAEAKVQRVEALAEEWRYKGEFGWGAWQEGQGPDFEGQVLDGCASQLRAALATPAPQDGWEDDEDPYDEPIFVQGHNHSEPICAWPNCATYLTRDQMRDLRSTKPAPQDESGEGRG